MTQQDRDLETIKKVADAQKSSGPRHMGSFGSMHEGRVSECKTCVREVEYPDEIEFERPTETPSSEAAAYIHAQHYTHACLDGETRSGPIEVCSRCKPEPIKKASGGSLLDNEFPSGASVLNTESGQVRHVPGVWVGAGEGNVKGGNAGGGSGPWPSMPGTILPLEDKDQFQMGYAGKMVEGHESTTHITFAKSEPYDAVEPPHYKRGPVIKGDIGSKITQGQGAWSHVVQCIEVMRHIKDPRLATAFKYLWRVAFGGKREPGETRTQREIDTRDIESAVWYLQDWLSNPTE